MRTLILLATLLTACGTSSTNNNPQPSYYSMTWNCGTNAQCAQNMRAWSGVGSFQVENDCLAWETVFINDYKGATVTACTYQQG